MTRSMYDSTTAGDCPSDGDLYAGYIDGRYVDYGGMVQLFPDKQHVAISVSPAGPKADVLDVETGDAAPADCGPWANRQLGLGTERPTVYCNRGNEDACAQSLADAGVPTDRAALWVATGGDPAVGPVTVRGYPVVACQDRTQTQTGGHYDASVVYDDQWPHVAPASGESGGGAQPGTQPTPSEEPTMDPQARAAVDKLTYVVGELVKLYVRSNPDADLTELRNVLHEETTDASAFQAQVDAVGTPGDPDIHTSVNNILRDLTGL